MILSSEAARENQVKYVGSNKVRTCSSSDLIRESRT